MSVKRVELWKELFLMWVCVYVQVCICVSFYLAVDSWRPTSFRRGNEGEVNWEGWARRSEGRENWLGCILLKNLFSIIKKCLSSFSC